MKHSAVFIFMVSFSLLFLSLSAQDLIEFPAGTLELQIEQIGGSNGASVAYNPQDQLYYCVMAGNASYPLETFSKSGQNLFQTIANNDMRGIWWNPKEKALEGNCYSDQGIVSIGLNNSGYAGTGNNVIFEGGNHQPNEQAVGAYDAKKKEILYYNDGAIVGYSRKTGDPTDTYMKLELPVDEYDLNWTTLIFTGVKKMELGVLNIVDYKIYLFNRKDGTLTGTVNLPSGITLYEGFNFAFANNYIFLFDKDERKWTGYKIFN